MIDFRYHVVSVVAVFLALATGLVLGASLLNAPLIESQNQQNDDLIEDKEALRDQVQELEAQQERLEVLADGLGEIAVRDKLAGRQVVLIALPGSEEGEGQAVVEGVTDNLLDAGSEIVGTVRITEAWTDPDELDLLDQLASSLTPEGIDLPEGTAYDRAAVVLASALVRDDEPDTPPTENEPDPGETTSPTVPDEPDGPDRDAATSILEGLLTGEFIAYDERPARFADLAVVIAPPPPAEVTDQTPITNSAWIKVAAALAGQDAATVLTGPAASAEEDGAINALREDGLAASEVSTADSAQTAAGQVAAVLALVAQVAGQTGHYGQVGDVDGPLPVLTGAEG